MHLSYLSLALVALLPTALTLAVPLQPRSAPYSSLLGLTTTSRDTSTTDPRHPTKYFHESTSHPHYDGRFTTTLLPRATRLFHMKLLLRAYTAAMERAGVRTWAMHGSLLAWWWSGTLFPWDSDLDFCVTEEGGRELGAWWNMSVVAVGAGELGLDVSPSGHAASGGRDAAGGRRAATVGAVELIQQPPDLQPGVWDKVVAEGKKYLLEVNPHAFSPAPNDRYNAIDARWIDTATGLFIDITIVHRVPPSKPVFSVEEPEEQMYTKDTHLYTTASLFPLRRARFEGVDVWVPYAYEQVLIEEYGPRALVETGFDGWVFEGGRWVQGAESGAVGGRGGGGEGTVKGGFERPERTDSEARERGRVDNGGAEVYQPRPGRAGDVHVVPGVS
ncbi:hypothetical protein C7974DRAFT_127837 [Boeremia exigua]|uniref:uncharacterized protein n=1 Tax=Boeremia exigua TaxID=749465 RepID=UPI001E8EC535|nr:uncharacterized protein C7974DRAFT_127837 [Boeremia exigua]KAH6639247.1 hypothetical protein C7974DRAFT_127837 [Boeremia exigua]